MTGRSRFLYDERQKRMDHPARLREFNLWDDAMRAMAGASNTMNDVARWQRDPDNFPEPDLVFMISEWMKSKELLQMLNHHQPVEFSEEQGKELDLFTVDQIDGELIDINGLMEGAEDYSPEPYQALLNRQLTALIEKWREAVTQPYEKMDKDADEVWDLCDERDTLEYTRAGVNAIRMQQNLDTRQLRLPNVEYDHFRKSLRDLDVVLRRIIENEKREKRFYRDVNAPQIFWWRR